MVWHAQTTDNVYRVRSVQNKNRLVFIIYRLVETTQSILNRIVLLSLSVQKATFASMKT